MSSYNATLGETFDILKFDRPDLSWHNLNSTTFATMQTSVINSANGYSANLSYVESGGDAFVRATVVIPEPSSFLFLSLGTLMLSFRSRKREH